MLLEIDAVDVFYGPVQALHQVSIAVAKGEVVAVLGGNASGKSTTLKAVLQAVKPRAGHVRLDGQDLAHATTPDVIERGVASIPESRRLFAEMTVEENVLMGLYAQRGRLGRRAVKARLDEAIDPFPVVKKRLRQQAGTLSGGEQQMVAMARALIQRPRLIVIDEPSMGLSPAYVETVYALLGEWKRAGTTMLIVEQSANQSLALSDRAYVLQNGRVVLTGPSADLANDPRIQSAYLGGIAA